jgi:mannitol 2-dehydrogenase
MWSRYCQGTDETGGKVPPSDTEWEKLNSAAVKAKTEPQAWLGLTEIYGSTGSNKRFAEAFAAAVKKVNADGVEAAMQEYVAKNGSVVDSNKENNPTVALT